MISLVAVTVVFIMAVVAGAFGHDVHWGRIILVSFALWLVWWVLYRLVIIGDDL